MNQDNKALFFYLVVAVVVFFLVSSSCGIVATVPASFAASPPASSKSESVNKKSHINTVTICGRWNIRPAAGDLAGHLGWLEDGDTVAVRIPALVVEDMSLWYELGEGGWVNGRAICR